MKLVPTAVLTALVVLSTVLMILFVLPSGRLGSDLPAVDVPLSPGAIEAIGIVGFVLSLVAWPLWGARIAEPTRPRKKPHGEAPWRRQLLKHEPAAT